MRVGEKVKGRIALLIGGICLTSILLISSVYTVAKAHPGNTASDGCHYCRTNCDKWGEVYGERHCHGGSTSTASNGTTEGKSDNSFWLWAGGVGIVGYLGYKYFEDKNNK